MVWHACGTTSALPRLRDDDIALAQDVVEVLAIARLQTPDDESAGKLELAAGKLALAVCPDDHAVGWHVALAD